MIDSTILGSPLVCDTVKETFNLPAAEAVIKKIVNETLTSWNLFPLEYPQ
jgi:hypothetical protein